MATEFYQNQIEGVELVAAAGTGSTVVAYKLRIDPAMYAPLQIPIVVRDWPGLPLLNDPHPYDATLLLRERRCAMINDDPAWWMITDTYAIPEAAGGGGGDGLPSIRYRSATATVQTKLDRSGTTMTVGPFDVDEGGGKTRTIPEEVVELETDEEIDTFEIRQRVATLPDRTFKGKLNHAPWYGFPTETVRCVNIEVEEAGNEWVVTYEFAYKPDIIYEIPGGGQLVIPAWAGVVALKDPLTGAPAKGVALPGPGMKAYQTRRVADFSLIPLQVSPQP